MAAPADPWYRDEGDDRPHIHFSGTELLHLLASTVVLTIGFAFALGETSLFFSSPVDLGRVFELLPYSGLIVLTSFILHEFAHKVVAQLRHMWAEFRASVVGLVVALSASIGFGVVLAAPGAVVIYGQADDRDAGIISIVGPWVNLVLGFLAFPFTLTRSPMIEITGIDLFRIVMFINAFLAAFNMLPISPLDGSKVWRWNKAMYLFTVVAIVGLFALWALGETVATCTGQAC